MAGIDQLDPLLQSLQALKPPGASKGKIAAITTLCVENVQSESVIAQRLYRHLKKTPGTHKLGVLYVVDSVTRQWIERAKQSGQELLGAAAPDGTFASGVYKITELLPALTDDLIQNAPQDHKAKVENLVQIWERGNTFPPKLLADIKKKLAPSGHAASRTPPGSPPLGLLMSLGLKQSAEPQPVSQPAAAPPVTTQQDASSILAALAHLQPMPAAPAPPPSAPPAVTAVAPAPPPPMTATQPQDIAALLSGLGQPQAFQNQAAYAAPFAQPSSTQPSYTQTYPPPPMQVAPQQAYGAMYPSVTPVQQPLSVPPPQVSQQSALGALAAILPSHILSNPQLLADVLKLFQGLAQEGIPQDQWGQVIQALYPDPQQNAPPQAAAWAPQQDQFAPVNDAYGGYRDRSPDRGARRRSRSPDFRRGKEVSGRRPSPVYGVYDASAANSHHDSQQPSGDKRNKRRGGRDPRQRTPTTQTRNGQTKSPSAPHEPGPKWTDMDPTMPPGHIKVLSRTLFVGGATGTEQELRAIFGRFGQVQTCIANEDKRHAFVKMCTRKDAVSAKMGMENVSDSYVLSKARQTKWGVGFGPRECCDYATGISVIPIDTLTDADHKWMLTAEYGGTGGRPIESGLVVEEPDIEIGAGVSSKAMSRRVGPESGRGGRRHGGGANRFRQPERAVESPRQDPITIAPPVPSFGAFNFGNVPGMRPL